MDDRGKCIEGVTIPKNGPCPVCGHYDFQPCGKREERKAKKRADEIADRAEKRAQTIRNG